MTGVGIFRTPKKYRTGRSSFVYIFARLPQAEKWTKTKGFCCSCNLYFCLELGANKICHKECGKSHIHRNVIH